MISVAFYNFPNYYHMSEELKLEVKQYLKQKNNYLFYKYFDSTKEIIIPYDFYFGFVTKEEDIIDINTIRKKFSSGEIVLVSETLDFTVLGFEYLCFGYLIVPLNKKDLYRLLDNMCKRNKREIISVQTPTGLKRFYSSDLKYVNIEGRQICYHLKDKDIFTNVLRKSFKETVNKNLLSNPCFLFLSPSLVINLEKIRGVNKNGIIEFEDETSYPVSKTQIEKILKRFNE